MSGSKEVKKNNRHHEQTEAAQKGFIEKVKQLKSVIQEMGNPFMEESDDLFVLDTKDIADESQLSLSKYITNEAKSSLSRSWLIYIAASALSTSPSRRM